MSLPLHLVTTCGTSVLNQPARKMGMRVPFDVANASAPEEVEESRRDEVTALLAASHAAFGDADADTAIGMSAEWASTAAYLEHRWDRSDVRVTLLASSTWLGRATAEIVASRLRRVIASVVVVEVPDLVTDDLTRFRSAMAWLSTWCESSLDRSRERVVFNATGGFKAWSAVLQTFGMLHADETVFLFERTSSLLRVPRLPLQFDAGALFQLDDDGLRLVRSLAAGNECSREQAEQLHPLLTMVVDDEALLSEWGTAAWNRAKRDIGSSRLLPPWHDGVAFAESFKPSLQGLPGERLAQVNDRIDDLCRYAASSGQLRLKRLDLKPIRGSAVADATHEIDAWSDETAPRIYLERVPGGWSVVRLGASLH